MKSFAKFFSLLLIYQVSACHKVDEFEDIGDSVASPIDIVASSDGKYFYVLNSDFDRTYGSGSILVIDENGDKKGYIETPRLGRSIAIAGNDLIATFDIDDDDTDPEVRLYDISSPTKPELVKTWSTSDDLDCNPINVVMREDYDHFAVACRGGKLFIGTLKDTRSKSTLKLVRDYEFTRRAMYIDVNRELLFAFVTDYGPQTTGDAQYEDTMTYDTKTGKSTTAANEIPDDFEESEYQRKNSKNRRLRYQYVVYDIGTERDKDFEFVKVDDSNPTRANSELRWLYFTLSNFDGTPEVPAQVTDFDTKLYRTNFWEAKPDPQDSNSFYLSHRGRHTKESRFVNAVIKVSIVGDVTDVDDDGTPPTTSSVLDFSLVYGFEGELNTDEQFAGDFDVLDINGRNTLIVNHFRDLVNFRDDYRFGIVAKVLDGGFWRDEISTTSSRNSYYQLAANSDGKVLTCAFYGNSVIPLEVTPGTGISIGWNGIKRIE